MGDLWLGCGKITDPSRAKTFGRVLAGRISTPSIVILLIAAIAASIGSCGPSVTPAPTDQPIISTPTVLPEETSLELSLGFDREKYCNIEEVVGIATITNVGKQSILVDDRWWVDPGTATSLFTTGYVIVFGPNGNLLEPNIYIDYAPVEADDFILLAPGDAKKLEINVLKIYRNINYIVK